MIIGDARERLRELPAESVDCVITSPPYFGLRDYGVAGQLGLEPTPDAYVAELVAVFREVRRVLRKDGTVWLNLGDSYAGSGKGGNPDAGKQATNKGSQSVGSLYGTGKTAREVAVTNVTRKDFPANGIKPKDLIGIPWRVAFALQADGWWLRSDIIWSKTACMPESVTDRPTKSHEYVFLLSKQPSYFYDATAIREPNADPDRTNYTAGGRTNGSNADRQDNDLGTRSKLFDPNGRNKRSVWTVYPQPFPEAHFATFPPALIEPCIKAGCPKGGTVLDPFGGAGTTGLVADRLQRNAILIELNPEYAAMAERRIAADRGPLFADAAE
jgi:DNA modification methylase